MEPILIFIYVYAFVVGCCVASFINVVIYRLPLGLSVSKGRSFCPSCHHQLSFLDLFPILSYLCLGGKCRYCGAKIPAFDTFLEFVGGCLAMFCFYHFGFSWMTLISFVFVMVLMAITMIDLHTMTIPDELVMACLIVGLMSFPVMELSLIDRVIGFFVISVPLLLMNFVIPDCFGGGDIKLVAACGLFLGWKLVLVGMFLAILMAGIYASVLLITHQVDRKGHIAFGPYICIGMFVALCYGDVLLKWYLSLFGF